MNIFHCVFRLFLVISLTHIGYSKDENSVKESYTSESPYLYWTKLNENSILSYNRTFYPQASSLNQRNLLNEIAIQLFGASEDNSLIDNIKFQKFLSKSKLKPKDVVNAQYDSKVQYELQKISITEIKDFSNLPFPAQNAISKVLEHPEFVQEPLKKILRDYVDSKTKTLKTFFHEKNGMIQQYLVDDMNDTKPVKHSIFPFEPQKLPDDLRKILKELFSGALHTNTNNNSGGSPYQKPGDHHGSRFDHPPPPQ